MRAVLRSFLLITSLCPLLVYGQGGQAPKVTQINKVVIDPGHGGKHPGAVYKNFYEKDITLSVGLKLGDLIKKNFPDVQVIYTRTTDKYVDLDERGRIANKAAADLFISIHINSAKSSSAAGTSTYVMGLDKSGKNLEVAMKENDVVIYEEDYSTKYEGYKPGDPTSYIIFSLMQSAHLEQSMQLAEIVQKHFRQDLPMTDLGARQGPFLVLWDTSMPSILTEIGFLSNAKDREYIVTNKGQNAAARSLFNAFSEYKSRVEGRSNVLPLKDKAASSASAAVGSAPSGKAEGAKATTSARTPMSPPAEGSTSVPTVTPAAGQTAKPAATGPGSSTQPTSGAVAAGSSSSEGIKFYVQIASLSRPKNLNSPDFKSYKGEVVEIGVGGMYKYLIGGYAAFEEAGRKLSEVKKELKDAFVVAFEAGRPVKLDEARRRASMRRN